MSSDADMTINLFTQALAAFPDVDAVRNLMIINGELKDAIDSYGMTLGMHAVHQGNPEMLHLFYGEMGADIAYDSGSHIEPYIDLIEGQVMGQGQAIHHAAEKNCVNSIHVLSKLGADIMAITIIYSMPPLSIAAKYGNVDAICALVELGANLQGTLGETPLYWATDCGRMEAMRTLIEFGADVNDGGSDWTPAFVAAQNGNLEVVLFLVEAGADVNITNNFGDSPMCMAASEGHAEVIYALAAAGGNLENAKENPMHFAAMCGQPGTIQALAELGAGVVTINQRGRTPFDARDRSSEQVIHALAQAGCPQSRVHQFERRWPYIRWLELAARDRVTINPNGPAVEIARALSRQYLPPTSAGCTARWVPKDVWTKIIGFL